jgi:glycosyltransferase involved in cell wall biosynthesis
MAQVLNDAAPDLSASYFFADDHDAFDAIADLADTVIICRSRYGAAVSHLIAKCRARGRRVLFDVDDLVFDPAYTRLLVNTLGLDTYDDRVWDEWFAMTSRLGATLRLCDGAITTNGFLAERITAFSGLPAAVVPNFLNREQLEVSDTVYRARSASAAQRPDETIVLGYFSGSPSHRLDYAICERAIAEVMRRNEQVQLLVAGYIESSGALDDVAGRVHKIPFQDYVNLQRMIGNVDFNLMPLQSNTFTDCKSELKFFDAAAVGCISIASPSRTYRAVIDDGVTGYLSRGHEWQGVIEKAITERSGAYRRMVDAARGIVDERYTWRTQRPAILRALGIGPAREEAGQ